MFLQVVNTVVLITVFIAILTGRQSSQKNITVFVWKFDGKSLISKIELYTICELQRKFGWVNAVHGKINYRQNKTYRNQC